MFKFNPEAESFYTAAYATTSAKNKDLNSAAKRIRAQVDATKKYNEAKEAHEDALKYHAEVVARIGKPKQEIITTKIIAQQTRTFIETGEYLFRGKSWDDAIRLLRIKEQHDLYKSKNTGALAKLGRKPSA